LQIHAKPYAGRGPGLDRGAGGPVDFTTFPLATGLPSPISGGKNLNTARVRDLGLLCAALALTALGATLSQSQGALKGKVLPVVSSSDVIGYTAPCG